MIKKFCKIIKEYESPFLNPLILKKGEKLLLEDKECEWEGWIWANTKEGQSGWVPKSYLRISKMSAELLIDYDATELSASIGQTFLIEKQESGWIWVTSKNGKYGWIPLKNVEIIK